MESSNLIKNIATVNVKLEILAKIVDFKLF